MSAYALAVLVLASTTNALGEVTVYKYNFQGRKTYAGGGTYPVRFTYDEARRRFSVINDGRSPEKTTPLAEIRGDVFIIRTMQIRG